MFQYHRLNDLFSYVYHHEAITPKELAKHLHVSVRTIRSDIILINETLIDHGAEIILKRNQGYFIKINDHSLFHNYVKTMTHLSSKTLNLDTPESRIQFITEKLLSTDDYLEYADLEQSVYVSFNTLQNYLKTISKNLEEYYLELMNRTEYGVKVIGEEKSKRKCLMDTLQKSHTDEYISLFSNEEYYLFAEYGLDQLRQNIYQIFINHHISITDINLKNLIIHITIMLLRTKNDHYIHFSSKIEIDTSYLAIINEITTLLENDYHFYTSEGEKQYLYIHIVSNTNYGIIGINNDQVSSYITTFLDYIYQDYNFDLRHDTLLIDDLTKHMTSILSTKFINPNKKNLILNTIKSNFPLPYEITLTSLNKTFTNSEYELDEDDAGYISLHIGAAIERIFNGKFVAKNVILVCNGSHATARILEARLNNYYSNKLNIVAIRSCAQIEALVKEDFNNIDFLISTAAIQFDYCPVVIVDFALKNKDIEAISKIMNTLQNQNRKEIMHFFDPNLFTLNKTYKNKIELLSDLTEHLLTTQIIETNFLDSVIEREELAKTNINNIFAFPHPMKPYAKETKVAVALLDKPLVWNDETVQIVFLLATKANEQQNMEKLYNTIVEIVNNPDLQKRILKATSYEEFIDALPD